MKTGPMADPTSLSEFNDETWIEVGVELAADIAARIADHAGMANPIVMTLVGVPMDPKVWLLCFD